VRVVIPALGTWGDVAPYIAVGSGLRRAGHDVLLATVEEYRPIADREGLDFQVLPGRSALILDWDPRRVSVHRPRQHIALVHRNVAQLVDLVRPEALVEEWRGADVVVFGSTTTFGHFNAVALGIRSIMAVLGPAVATSAFPQPVFAPGLRFGGYANYASWLIGERLQKQTFQEPLRPKTRAAVGLPAMPRPSAGGADARWPPVSVLHAFSSALVPRPADWPAHVEVTGWWPAAGVGETLSEEVERFLDAGSPPLYIGFGSMPVPGAEAVGEMIVDALRRTGRRAIVAGLPAASLCRAAPDVLLVDRVPHEALFERVAGVVHHGGSGTVGSGLRAGRPTLVVPFVYDQFFWGRCVADAGAGPRPLPFARLRADRLAAAFQRLGDPDVVAAAGRLGERIRTEDGVARAVDAIERVLA